MWVCGKCGEEQDEKFDVCWKCEEPRGSQPSRTVEAVSVDDGVGGSDYSAAAAYRYVGLYNIARSIVAAGTTVKAVGWVFALLMMVSLVGGQPFFGTSVFSGFSGVVIWGLGAHLAGMLVSALGRILLVQVDCAVHSSPFLTDDQRAMVMSLVR